LLEQLELMRDGMFGRLPELSHWCRDEGNAWANPDGQIKHGWEELPYWLMGYSDLGYILNDEKIILETGKWVERVLKSQMDDGYFGPRHNKNKMDLWPNMVMLNVLRSYYEATNDKRIPDFMGRYFQWQNSVPQKYLLHASWQKIRGGDNLESVHWLYNLTGEEWLLDLATKVHEQTADWTSGIASWHGVNICQGFREPAQYYQQSKDPEHLAATERNYREVMDEYGQVPGGMFGADERVRPGFTGPRQAAESCSMVEFMRSDEMLLGITGDPVYADRCEEIAFNSLPAALTPDIKGLHYLTSPNMVQLDKNNKYPGILNMGCMLAYTPSEAYRCCQHNVSHGWPYFSKHLWMATRDNGLAAVMYAPCEVEAKVGKGQTVRITEVTDYPFRDTVDFTVNISRPTRFPLMFRIPNWTEGASASVNGATIELEPSTYLVMERTWTNGDLVQLNFPMKTNVRTWKKNKGGVSIYHGPLAYSLKIGERWERVGNSMKWPSWEVLPTTTWNYGLVLDNTEPEVIRKDGDIAQQPFKPENAPIEIRVKGKKIPGWKMEDDGLAGRLQKGPIFSEEPDEPISLIPMGCARLRISVFPEVTSDPNANLWRELPPRFSASHTLGYIHSPADGEAPTLSSNTRVPRFVWGEHKGTTEWYGYGFDEPREVSKCGVFWFDDGGQSIWRVPESWKVLWKDGDVWREVSSPSEYGVELDKFNEVTFDPVVTDEIRLEVKLQDGFSGGLLEWTVE